MVRQRYFCIGAAKTGTTILARLLDQQPDVACLWEGFLLRPDHTSSVLNPEGKSWRRHGFSEAQVREWNERATSRMTVDGKTIRAMRHPPIVREIIAEVLDSFGSETSSTFVGDKWPDYHRHLKLMLRAFPDAKLLYNVRDPRGVWNSGQTFRGREDGDKVLANMLAVDDVVRPYLDDDRFMALRYEDLIANPVETMSRVAEFIGFTWDPDAIEYRREQDPFPGRWYWIPEAAGEPDVRLTEKWRVEMPAGRQDEVTSACGEFLGRYGYEA